MTEALRAWRLRVVPLTPPLAHESADLAHADRRQFRLFDESFDVGLFVRSSLFQQIASHYHSAGLLCSLFLLFRWRWSLLLELLLKLSKQLLLRTGLSALRAPSLETPILTRLPLRCYYFKIARHSLLPKLRP